MAQVIAGNTVTEVTRNRAKVGCTQVTRQDVEALLKSMDASPIDFEVFAAPRDGNDDFWVQFIMRGLQGGGGWVAVSEDVTVSELPLGYVNRFAQFCIERRVAVLLLEYLAKRLGYNLSVK